MKPLRQRLHDHARTHAVTQLVVERDYMQTYLLAGIASRPRLQDTLRFKGGTALKKVHFGRYRFSEDLDFSATDAPRLTALERELRAATAAAQGLVATHAEVELHLERVHHKLAHPGGQEPFRVRVRYPWQSQALFSIKIEVTHDEPVLLATPRLPIAHGYEEDLAPSITCYGLEEIVAEKLRATRQTVKRLDDGKRWIRSRGRDFYDLLHLTRLGDRIGWEAVARILPAKCAHRGVALRSLDEVFDPRLVREVRAQWIATLGPFVPQLPAVDDVLAEVRERLARLLPL